MPAPAGRIPRWSTTTASSPPAILATSTPFRPRSLRRWERVATPSAAPRRKQTGLSSVRRLLLLVAVVLQRGRRKPAANHAWQAKGHVAERRLDHANAGQGQLSGLAPPDHLALGQRSLAPDFVDVGQRVLANAFGLRGLCRVDDFVEDLSRF